MKNTYDGSTCCVKVDDEMTDWFEVTTGVRQGCVWSPLLFGIVIDWLSRTLWTRTTYNWRDCTWKTKKFSLPTTATIRSRFCGRHSPDWSRILGVSWQDHVPNEVIFGRTSQVPLINILRQKRLTWLGHVTRMHACPTACSTGNHEGAVAQAGNACAGKIQCRETCKTLNFPSKRQQW